MSGVCGGGSPPDFEQRNAERFRELAKLDNQQSRAVAELLIALIDGTPIPAVALTNLKKVVAQKANIRKEIL